MRVKDVMSAHLVTAPSTTSVMSARRMMEEAGIRHLPVVDNGKLVGMISTHDVTLSDRAIVAALSLLSSELLWGRYRRIATVMSAPVITIRPYASVSEAARLLRQKHLGSLAVVDEAGALEGIITTYDCLAALEHSQASTVAPPAAGVLPCRVPMPPGDVRPGRQTPRRKAIVVNPSALQRLSVGSAFAAEGYDVTTCPGPMAGARCPAMRTPEGARCPRLPPRVDLIVLDAASAEAGLRDVYRRWHPDAEIRGGPRAQGSRATSW